MNKVFLTIYTAVMVVLLVVRGTAKEEPTITHITHTETAMCITLPEAESTIEAITEPSVSIEETESSTALETTSYYNVNLSTEVQDCIITECERYNIPPEIVIAMVERESRFNANAIGDNGNSFGLMQIQPRWHTKRMEKLGCTDLLNPIQNIKVGIDFLGELYNRYGDIGKALTAYNTGSYNGTITNYAIAVMARANEVEYA